MLALRTHAFAWTFGVVLVSSCSSRPSNIEPPSPVDAAVAIAEDANDEPSPDVPGIADDPRLVVGEGQHGLDPIEHGRVLFLGRGCQGSQHVWISLRADAGFEPRGMLVRLDLVRVRDSLRVSLEFLARLSFQRDAGGTTVSLSGLLLQVPEPDLALGETLRLEAEITDRTGNRARTDRIVSVAWGTEVCGM